MHRRSLLQLVGIAAALPFCPSAAAENHRVSAEIEEFAAGALIKDGGIAMEIPGLIESGYAVPVTILATGSPDTNILAVRLLAPGKNAHSGRHHALRCVRKPQHDLRMRLARSQTVTVLAATVGDHVLGASRLSTSSSAAVRFRWEEDGGEVVETEAAIVVG